MVISIGIIIVLLFVIMGKNKQMKETEIDRDFWKLLCEGYKKHFSVEEIDGILNEIETTMLQNQRDQE